jgi:hypothetical protein
LPKFKQSEYIPATLFDLKRFFIWLENNRKFVALCQIDDKFFTWAEMFEDDLEDLFKEYMVFVEDKPGPGKYEGNEWLSVAEYLDSICGNGMYEEQYGDAEESAGWNALVFVDPLSLPEEYPMVAGKLKPAYIVNQDNNGFFSYTEFDSEDEARDKYRADLAEYESYYASEKYSNMGS